MREDAAPDSPDLLRRLRAGDTEAFEELVRTHQHRVFAVALRMLGRRAEAEEVAQDAFVRAYRAIADFRGDSRLSTWLYAITSRLCLNRLAAARRQAGAEGEETLLRVPSGHGNPGSEAERRELGEALRVAIAALPEERRIVLVLRDLEGLSYEEIGQVLGLEPGTVRSRLHRARLEIRSRLEGHLA